jgi:hypothetical protein
VNPENQPPQKKFRRRYAAVWRLFNERAGVTAPRAQERGRRVLLMISL